MIAINLLLISERSVHEPTTALMQMVMTVEFYLFFGESTTAFWRRRRRSIQPIA
jgi:hypothetical protein